MDRLSFSRRFQNLRDLLGQTAVPPMARPSPSVSFERKLDVRASRVSIAKVESDDEEVYGDHLVKVDEELVIANNKQ